jgi:muramidase (phage lysozyme)
MPQKKTKARSKMPGQVHALPKILKTAQEYEKLYKNSNIQAFLMTIRDGEGTLGPHGYYKHYGGGFLSTLDEQPSVGKTWSWGKKDHHPSSAVGAFMFLNTKEHPNWPKIIKIEKLQDFSEISQITGAEYYIDNKEALPDILAGDIISAIRKTKGTWTSLPGGKQQRLTMQEALEFFQEQGGTLNEANLNYIPILNWKNRFAHPVDPDNQYPPLPEYIKILMGKPVELPIDQKQASPANKSSRSGTGMPDAMPEYRVISTLHENGFVNKYNNDRAGIDDLISRSNTAAENTDRYLPIVKKEPTGRVHPLIENALIQPSYLNKESEQNELLNSPFSYLFPNEATGTGTAAGKKSGDISELYKGYSTPGIREHLSSKLMQEKDRDAMRHATKKQADHYTSSQSTSSRSIITINLNKPMIENFTIRTSNIKEGLNDFKHKVEEVLLEILNSANVIQ